jgi:hypothetical protein
LNRNRKYFFSLFLLFLCFFSLICFSLLTAQVPDTLWTRTFGGADWDLGRALTRMDSSHYIIAGYSHSFGNGYEVFLICIDQNGDSLWTKTFGGPNDDEAFDIKQTLSENYIIAGWSSSYGSGLRDAYLIHVSGTGDTIWTRTYGGAARDIAFGVYPTADGGFVFSGETRSSGNGQSDLYLAKANNQGDSLWAKTYGGSQQDFGYSVLETADSGLIAVGFTESFGSGMGDAYIVRTDASGDSIWAKTFGGSLDERAYKIQHASDGGFIITGYSASTGAGGNDVYVVKMDENGDSIWTRTYGGTQDDYGYDIKVCANGGYVITGKTRSFGSGNEDLYLLRITQDGDTIWTQTFGGSSDDAGSSIAVMPDSGLLIAGETYSYGAGGYDVWLLRMEPVTGIAQHARNWELGTEKWKLTATPDPFSSEVRIQISGVRKDLSDICPLSSDPHLQIYGISGRLIRSLSIPNSKFPIRSYTWDGRDEDGNVVPAGIYFIFLGDNKVVSSKKLVKVR